MKFSIGYYNELSKHYENESDRSAALLASSFLEHYLAEVLLGKLADHPVKDAMFKGFDPLATFAARSDFALLLGLIPEQTHDDLKIIRKIRNDFAHTPCALTFEEGRIKQLVGNLSAAKGIPRSDGSLRKLEGGRQQFFWSITWALIHIETQRERTSKMKLLHLRFEEVVDDDKA